MKTIYFILFTAILFTSCSKESVTEFEELQDINLKSDTALENEVFILVNEYRESIGLTALTLDNTVYRYSSNHSIYMASTGDYSHNNFSNRAKALTNETQALGVGENIARKYSTANEVVTAWLNSTNHRNTIEGDYTHTAIGIRLSETNEIYYTQIFIKK